MNSDHNTTEVHGNAALATTINNKGCVLLRFDSPATTIDNVACNLIQYILLSLPCIKLNPLYLSILFFFFFFLSRVFGSSWRVIIIIIISIIIDGVLLIIIFFFSSRTLSFIHGLLSG